MTGNNSQSTNDKLHLFDRKTLSLLASELGPVLSSSVVESIWREQITHLNLHANNLESLALTPDQENQTGTSFRLPCLQELDISSNLLGCIKSSALTSCCLLSISHNLVHLNLSANNITSVSLTTLFDHEKLRLDSLKTLDLSYNTLKYLPSSTEIEEETDEGGGRMSLIHVCCPHLETLILVNNQIRDLPRLLRALYSHRGVLQQLNLQQETTSIDLATPKSNKIILNPVCTDRYYRSRIVGTLNQLQVLDGIIVSELERDKALLNLSLGVVTASEKITSVMKKRVQEDRKAVNLPTDKEEPQMSKLPEQDLLMPLSATEKKKTRSEDFPCRRKELISLLKLNSIENQVGILTDLAQKQVEMTQVMLLSSAHEKPYEIQNLISHDTSAVNADVQTSFILIGKEENHDTDDIENITSTENGKLLKYHGNDNHSRITLLLAFQRWLLFKQDSKLAEIEKRIVQTNLEHSTTEQAFQDSLRCINDLKDEIETLSQKLKESDEGTFFWLQKYKRARKQKSNMRNNFSNIGQNEKVLADTLNTYQTKISLLEHTEAELITQLELARRELQKERELCNTLKVANQKQTIDIANEMKRFEEDITRTEQQKVEKIKHSYQALARNAADEKVKSQILSKMLKDMEVDLKQKAVDLERAGQDLNDQKQEVHHVRSELKATRKEMKEMKKIVHHMEKKELCLISKLEESAMEKKYLQEKLKQSDLSVIQKSGELEDLVAKFKLEVAERLRTERTSDEVHAEMNRVQIEKDKIVHELLEEIKGLQESNRIACVSEKDLRQEIEDLQNKIRHHESLMHTLQQNYEQKEKSILSSHQIDNRDKDMSMRSLEIEVESLRRSVEKVQWKKQRAIEHATTLAEELVHEKETRRQLEEQLKEAHKFYDNQNERAKAAIESVYKQLIQPTIGSCP